MTVMILCLLYVMRKADIYVEASSVFSEYLNQSHSSDVFNIRVVKL